MLDRRLVDIGQNGIGTAKGQQRSFGEEPAHLRQRVLPALAEPEHRHRQRPQQRAGRQHPEQARALEARMLGRRRVVVNQGPAATAVGQRQVAAAAATAQSLRREPRQQSAREQRRQHHRRKRHAKYGNRQKAEHRNGPGHRQLPGRAQRLAAYAVQRMQHDGRHRRLDAVEQCSHQRLRPPCHVDPAQSDQHQQRRQHKQHAGRNATPRLVHQPAQVSGQLLCFRSRQEHAKVERVQKAFFRHPAAPLHQLAVHDGDLSGRPAKTDESQLEPKAQGLPKWHRELCLSRCGRVHPRCTLKTARLARTFGQSRIS